MKFSFFSKPKNILENIPFTQIETFDVAVRTALFNAFVELNEAFRDNYGGSGQEKMFRQVWKVFLELPLDEFSHQLLYGKVRESFLDTSNPLEDLRSLISAIYDAIPENEWAASGKTYRKVFANGLNESLSRYSTGWRFRDGTWYQIDSEAQNQQVTDLLEASKAYPSVNEKVLLALRELGDPESTNYGAAVTDAISGLEALAVTLTGKKTLGESVKSLEINGELMHPSLREGLGKIYGWTNDQSNLRHGGKEASELDRDLAKFSILTIFAFINLLIAKQSSKGTS